MPRKWPKSVNSMSDILRQLFAHLDNMGLHGNEYGSELGY